MTISIPASDVVATNLNSLITNLTNELTNLNAATAPNYPLIFAVTKQKANAQMNLVLHLLGTGRILASNVLANETYTAGQDGGDQR